MPAKLVFSPRKIKSQIKLLESKYGKDILSRATNLYFYCFIDTHSNGIANLVREVSSKRAKIKFPFVKEGLKREWGMIYVFLLVYLLKGKNEQLFSWEDVVFIIQLTYVTGFLCDQRKTSLLKYMMNNQDFNRTVKDKTLGLFRSQFEFVLKHSLIYEDTGKPGDGRTYLQNQVVRKLIDKRKKFLQKYMKDEKVDFLISAFIKHSLEVSVDGYDANPLPPLKKLISGH